MSCGHRTVRCRTQALQSSGQPGNARSSGCEARVVVAELLPRPRAGVREAEEGVYQDLPPYWMPTSASFSLAGALARHSPGRPLVRHIPIKQGFSAAASPNLMQRNLMNRHEYVCESIGSALVLAKIRFIRIVKVRFQGTRAARLTGKLLRAETRISKETIW
jgi:hypothetical protein